MGFILIHDNWLVLEISYLLSERFCDVFAWKIWRQYEYGVSGPRAHKNLLILLILLDFTHTVRLITHQPHHLNHVLPMPNQAHHHTT